MTVGYYGTVNLSYSHSENIPNILILVKIKFNPEIKDLQHCVDRRMIDSVNWETNSTE